MHLLRGPDLESVGSEAESKPFEAMLEPRESNLRN